MAMQLVKIGIIDTTVSYNKKMDAGRLASLSLQQCIMNTVAGQ